MMTVVIAQFIGKKALDQISRVMKNGLKITLIPTLFIAVFLIFFSIFTVNKQVIDTSINYLKIIGVAFVLIPLCQMLMGFILGTGNTRFSFITFFVASIVEIIILFGIEYNINKPLFALGLSIIAWYITDIIFGIFYYFSKKRTNDTNV